MSEEEKSIEELITIVGKVSSASRNLIIASARAALFGEQAMRRQYGLSPEGYSAQPQAGERVREYFLVDYQA